MSNENVEPGRGRKIFQPDSTIDNDHRKGQIHVGFLFIFIISPMFFVIGYVLTLFEPAVSYTLFISVIILLFLCGFYFIFKGLWIIIDQLRIVLPVIYEMGFIPEIQLYKFAFTNDNEFIPFKSISKIFLPNDASSNLIFKFTNSEIRVVGGYRIDHARDKKLITILKKQIIEYNRKATAKIELGDAYYIGKVNKKSLFTRNTK
jgi:hypothetical protein